MAAHFNINDILKQINELKESPAKMTKQEYELLNTLETLGKEIQKKNEQFDDDWGDA